MNRYWLGFLTAAVLLLPRSHALVESDEEIRAAIEGWENAIQKVDTTPSGKTFSFFGQAVKKLSRKNWGDFQNRADNLYVAAQAKAITIPGHAQYFADEIRREQQDVRDASKRHSKVDYDRNRKWYLVETLQHLPSPETVHVLGEFLADDLDQPPPLQPGQDWTGTSANSVLSVRALEKIGLRNAPETKPSYAKKDEILPPWRAWWEEVKAGKRSFSFVGQNVEYRFNPDGSVKQQPYTGPADASPTKPEKSQSTPAPQQPQPQSEKPMPWFFWLGGAMVVFGGILLWMKRSSPGDERK